MLHMKIANFRPGHTVCKSDGIYAKYGILFFPVLLFSLSFLLFLIQRLLRRHLQKYLQWHLLPSIHVSQIPAITMVSAGEMVNVYARSILKETHVKLVSATLLNNANSFCLIILSYTFLQYVLLTPKPNILAEFLRWLVSHL